MRQTPCTSRLLSKYIAAYIDKEMRCSSLLRTGAYSAQPRQKVWLSSIQRLARVPNLSHCYPKHGRQADISYHRWSSRWLLQGCNSRPHYGIIACEVPLYQPTLRRYTDAQDSGCSDRSPRARRQLGCLRAGKRKADKPES